MTIQKTREDIVNFALTLLGVKAADEEAETSDIVLATEGLDDLVKVYQSTGAHLWSRRSATLFLKPGQAKYIVGPQTTTLSTGAERDPDDLDHMTEEYWASSLVNAVAQGASTFELPDTVNVTCDEDSVIQVDDFVAFITSTGFWWSKVKSILPTTPAQILIDGDFPEALAAGTIVNWYREGVTKVLRIPDARRQQGFAPNSQEIEMVQMGRIDYLNLPNKYTQGTPVQFYYTPNVDNGEMYLWPVGSTTDYYVNATIYRALQVFDNSESAADFPNEWLAALKYNLAVHLAPAYGGRELPANTTTLAKEYLKQAMEWDQGDAPAYFEYAAGRGM